MAVLRLQDERTQQSWQVWPDVEHIPPGVVHELGSYLFELHGSADAGLADLFIDDQPLEALRARNPGTARWRWSPGFHAGTVLADLRLPGGMPRRFEIVTDPDQRKLTRDHFDSMVREIMEDTFALFSLSGFRKTVAHGIGNRPPAIARLEFLRSRIEELETVIAAILRNPRRRLVAEECVVPYHQAKHATGPEILRSLRSGRFVRESPSEGKRLPAALQGFLPAKIRVQRKLNSLDIPEHRQIGACLRSWAAWLAVAADQLEGKRKGKDNELQRDVAIWVTRCRGLARRISHLATAEAFGEAASVPARMELSSVFRRDPAYRQFYRLWQDINRGIAAVFGDFLDMPLARTWELYELWCFLRLLRASAKEFGPSGVDITDLFVRDGSGGVTLVAGAVTVSVGSGWKLCFQKQYREFWLEDDGCGSYSRSMAPDVVAVRDGGEAGPHRLVVLDAKYRIDEALNDALGSIHIYRNALVRETETGEVEGVVSAAYLMTPHVPLYSVDGNYRDAAMPGRLFRPDYQTTFRFGAISLRPGMDIEEIIQALRRIVADATLTPE